MRITVFAAVCCTSMLAACDRDAAAPAQSYQPASTAVAAATYTLEDLGAYQGVPSNAFEIDDYERVYGRYGSGDAQRSFRWTSATGFEDLGDFNGQPFQVLRANNRGLLSGWVPTGPFPAPMRPVVYRPGKGFRFLMANTYNGSAWGVNDLGVVVGTRNVIGGSAEAFIWTLQQGASTPPLTTSLGTIRSSSAVDVNNSGVVAGSMRVQPPATPCCQTHAFVWSGAATLMVPKPEGAVDIAPTALNDAGVVVGAYETRAALPGETRTNVITNSPGDVPIHAWRWSNETGFVDLGTLGGPHSVAWNVDRRGNAYGWATDAAGVHHAVVWKANGRIKRLGNIGGPSETGAANRYGVVAARAADNTGLWHAVLYRPVTE